MDERSRKENDPKQVLSVPRTIDENGAGGRLRVYSRALPGLALGVVTGDSRATENLPAENENAQALTPGNWTDFFSSSCFPLLSVRGEMTSAHSIHPRKAQPPSLVVNHFS
jgi:hypothetical protein